MIVENYPVYSPVKDGLAANYTINFGADLNHFLPLGGMFQGDAVKSKSLYVNNYNNAFSFSAIVGNDTLNIPAYRDGYIDVSHVDQVIFQSNQPGSVTVTVYNYANPVTDFSQRGVPPGQVNTTIQSNDNISQGDIVVQGADGLAYWGNDPNAAYSTFRPINQASAQYNQPLTAAITLNTTNTARTYSFILSNGNIGILYNQTSSKNLYFTAMDTSGNVTVQPVLIVSDFYYSTGAGIYTLNAVGLSGGGFALVYINNPAPGTYYQYFCIFNSVGQTVLAPQQLSTINGYQNNPKVCQLTNDNIVVTYEAITAHAVSFNIYSPSGNLVVNGANVAASVNNAVQELINFNAGFAIGTVSGYQITVSVYDNNGNQIGAPQKSTYTLGYAPTVIISAILSNGNIAMAGYGLANYTVATWLIVDQNSNMIVSPNTSIGGNLYAASLAPTNDGGFLIVTGYSTTFGTQKISATGTIGTLVTLSSSYSFSSSSSVINAIALSSGNIAVAFIVSPGAANICIINNGGTLLGSVTASGISSDNPLIYQVTPPVPLPQSFFSITGCTTLGVFARIFADDIQVSTPLGIAMGPATPGQNVTVQISGSAQTRLTFKNTYSVNAQSQTPPGQKMYIVGNAATMQGMQ